MADEIRTTRWSDWDAETRGFECEAGVGLTVLDDMPCAGPDGSRWLSWEETVAMHAWLGAKIKDFENGPA